MESFEESRENGGDELYIPDIELITPEEIEQESDFSDFLKLRTEFNSRQPELSAEEKQAATHTFISGVDDCLLGNIEDSYSSKEYYYTDVRLRYDFQDGSGDKFVITAGRGEQGRNVLVSHYGERAKERTYYYVDDADSTVKRFDNPDRHFGGFLHVEQWEGEEDQDYLERASAESKANELLGEALRVNKQPIPLEEAQRLVELLRHSMPRDD